MATTTSNFGWPIPQSTDLVKDGATAIAGLGSGVDTSMAQLKGGTTGQMLTKTSNTDMAFTWITPQIGDITAVTAGTGISGGGTTGDVTITNSMATTIDAKGDLIVGTGNDTFNRLAAGSDGSILVANSAASTGLGWAGQPYANPVLNSAFQVWQRGTSIAGANSTTNYVSDRWQGYRTNTTFSRQTTSDTTNLPNIQYCMRVQRNSGQTGTGDIWLAQSLESINSICYAGKTITLSFYARKGADYSASSSALNVKFYSGTGTDQTSLAGFTGSSTLINQNATLTTTWQRFSYSAAIGSTATEIGIEFDFIPTGTAGANDYYEITGVQIDLGSVALPFRTYAGTIQGELAACQRYYYRLTSNAAYGVLASNALAYDTGQMTVFVSFPSQMRIVPTAIDTSATSTFAFDRGNTGAGNTPTSIAIDTTTNQNIGIYTLNKTSTFTANVPYRVYANNSSTAYVGFTAEL